MENFKAYELVCRHVYTKYGEAALNFADPRLLSWLDWFREKIGLPVYVNNYMSSGKYSQRGYRCNLCSLVADKTAKKEMYLSAHTRFQAVDFNVSDMKDEEVRQWIDRHKSEMPCNIRIENATAGWVHVDVACPEIGPKITYFNA